MSSTPQTPRLRSAALTFLAGQSRDWGKQLVNLAAWPLVVNGLTLPVYGLWVLIHQLAGYVQFSDLRVSSVLGLLLARERRSADDERKRRLVGAHLVISSLIAALIASLGMLLVVFAPAFFRLDDGQAGLFRIALGISVAGVLAAPFLAIPNMALYSQNQAYRGFAWVFAFDLLGPVLGAAVVVLGLGLIGLSTVTVLLSVAAAFVLLLVARRHLPWLGVRRPAREEVRQMLGNGLRYQVDGLAVMLSENSAAILLGWMCGMREVAVFAVTERLLRVSQIATNRLCNAAAPVVGEFAGASDREALRRAWSLLGAVNNVVAFGAFLVVVPLNTLILDLLLGPGRHGGTVLSALLGAKVLMMSRTAPPAYFLNQMLLLRQKNRWSLAWVAVLVGAALVLVPRHGMTGMAIAMLLGAFVVQHGYAWQVFRALGHGPARFLREETLVSLVALAAGAVLTLGFERSGLHGLLPGLVAASGLVLCAGPLIWRVVLRAEQRASLTGLLRRLAPARGASA